jgi:plasmid replication initiation protein
MAEAQGRGVAALLPLRHLNIPPASVSPPSTGVAALLPLRHLNADFFVCDVFNVIPKDDMASMEHPIFSLTTKPDTTVRSYRHNGVSVDIIPSVRGVATIYDKDIIIYCISQLIAKRNAGEEPNRTLHIRAHDLLVTTNRETSGRGYWRLREALERLAGTRITTNVVTGGEEITEGFGLVENWRIIRQTKSGRMISVRITLSEWMYNAILGKEVLTLHRDYFRLRKPLERRMYEIARKHCGKQDRWNISLATLQKKCGSVSNPRLFKLMVRKLIEHDHLPDYSISLRDNTVTFHARGQAAKVEEHRFPVLDPETFHDARTVAPGYDVYALQEQWREWWLDSGGLPLKSADAAFIGFCKRRYERNPNP